MCGISGEISFNGRPNEEAVKSMGIALSHRGPDGLFCKTIDGLSVAFNWLAITDRSAVPPMSFGDWVVWLNGEIYNYQQLRDTLEIVTEVKTNCDTEILVIGLEYFGLKFIEEINGMFCIAAYNRVNCKLYLSRDRFGVKQMYYYRYSNGLIFSSEPKGILKHPYYKFSVNTDAVGQWLTFQNNFSNETLFSGIKLLPSGTILEAGNEPYYFSKLNFCPTEEKEKYYKEALKEAIRESFFIQRPKEYFGAWVSGGIDSGIIASEMRPDVYITAGWNDPYLDERNQAYKLTSKLPGTHLSIPLNELHLMGKIESTICSLDDLRVGPSWSNYIINSTISKHCRITLQGTGADELFAGYDWRYGAENYYDVIDRTKLQSGFINHEFSRPELPKSIYEKYTFDMTYFMNGVLIVGDRLSSAFGIEERVPFLDNNVANVALKMPSEFKKGKKILYELFPYMERRQKRGFTSPDKVWYKNYLYLWVSDTLINSRFLGGYINKKYIPSVIESNNAPALWSLLCLHFWLKTYAYDNGHLRQIQQV